MARFGNFYNRQKFILDLNDWEPNLLNRFIFFEDLCSGDLTLFFENLFMEICPLKICSRDLSIEDWSVGDLSLFKDLFIEIYPLKIYSGNFSFYSWRFIHWRLKCRRFVPFRRFVHRDFSFEDLFRRFFLLWRCVHGDLSIEDWSVGDLSLFKDWFMKICHLKIWIGDLSLKDLFMVICHLKICSGDFSFWNFE